MGRNGVTDRIEDLGPRARTRMMDSKLEKLDRENARLHTEVGLLRSDLEDERGSLEDALSALKRRPVDVKVERGKGSVLRSVVIASIAYVIGTRAGRERYDQLRDQARSAWFRLRSSLDPPQQQPLSPNSWEAESTTQPLS